MRIGARPESKGGPNVGQTLRRFVACNDGSVTERIIRRGWWARTAQADYRTSRISKSPPLHEPFERPGTLPFERAGTLPYSPEYGFQ
jgi:hypothetical protein